MENNVKTALELIKEKAKKFTILYVEDEKLIRNSTGHFLNKLFQKVDVAIDGKDGLDKYIHNKYDIVITDISMPKMNGLELISHIRKNNINQEIIIMTAHTESEYTDQVNTSSVTGIIYKPTEINQMLEILNLSIERLNPLCSGDDT